MKRAQTDTFLAEEIEELNQVPCVVNAETSVWVDMGNTQTRIAIRGDQGRFDSVHIPTRFWQTDLKVVPEVLNTWLERQNQRHSPLAAGIIATVAPASVEGLIQFFNHHPLTREVRWTRVSSESNLGIGIDYPDPGSIGADRLANAVAACKCAGFPSVVVDFGTAVTFDVVNEQGCYVGGVICPGLNAMTDYLHEKTALLPRIEIQDIQTSIGKSTREAMLIGAVHGYRGLIQSILDELSVELKSPDLSCMATGGYASLISKGVRRIHRVDPWLTLKGLCWIGERMGSPDRELRESVPR